MSWPALVVALIALAACSTGPRLRQFESGRAGAEAAIAVLLQQPPDAYGRLQLTVSVEHVHEPAERWMGLPAHIKRVASRSEDPCDFDCQRLFVIEGVMGYDRSEAPGSAGFTATQVFAPTLDGAREAMAWRDAKPRDTRIVIVRQPVTRMPAAPYTWTWSWRDVSGDLEHLRALESHVCLWQCFRYEDVRALYFTAGTQGMPGSFRSEQHPVSRETLPGLIRTLMARPEPSKTLQLETLAIANSSVRLVELYEVSVLEDGRICGAAAEAPSYREERCYDFAKVQQIAVSDHHLTAGETFGDALTTPFRVLGRAAGAIGIGGN